MQLADLAAVVNMDDIFSMFGDISEAAADLVVGGGGRTRKPQYRGGIFCLKVRMTLQEISTGVTKKFKVKKQKVACPHCHGSGAEGSGATETCPTCHGNGFVVKTQQSIFGMMQTQAVCPTCGGEGTIIKNKCKEWRGRCRQRRRSH